MPPPPPPSLPSTSTPTSTAAAAAKAQTPSQLTSSRPSVSLSTRRNRSSKKPSPTPALIPPSIKRSDGRSLLAASRSIGNKSSNSSDKLPSGLSATEKRGRIGTSSNNDKENKKTASAAKVVRAGTSKSRNKNGSRSLRTPVPAGSPSVTTATAAPSVTSVTGKRKRGKGSSSKNVVAIIREQKEDEDDDELGQGNIDTRFSPASSLTVRRNNASTAKTTGLKGAKGLTRQSSNGRHHRDINDNDKNNDDEIDELASPGQLEKKVRKTNSSVAVRKMISRQRVPSFMQDDDDDGGDEITSATNSVVAALLSRKLEGEMGERTLRESRSEKRRVPVKKGQDKEEKLSSRVTGRKPRRLQAEVGADKHAEYAESKEIETPAKSAMSSSHPKIEKEGPKNKAKSKAKGQVKVMEENNAESEKSSRTITRTRIKKLKPRDTEALDEDEKALSDEGLESVSVVPHFKAPKPKQIRAKTRGRKKKPVASEPPVPEIIAQTPSDNNEQLSQPNDCTGENSQESAESEKQLLEDAKQSSTGFLTAQQPVNNIDNDQKSVSTINSATSSFTTATTASTQPSTIHSLSIIPESEPRDVKTADVHAHSETKTNDEVTNNLPDNWVDNNVEIPDHQADLSDRKSDHSDTANVDQMLSKRAHSDTSDSKRLRGQILDVQREKEMIKARIEEARREDDHVNENTEAKERERLTKMMEDLRHVVRRGRTRVRETGWSGEMSLVSSAKGAQGVSVGSN